jgi:hypothetical protein
LSFPQLIYKLEGDNFRSGKEQKQDQANIESSQTMMKPEVQFSSPGAYAPATKNIYFGMSKK